MSFAPKQLTFVALLTGAGLLASTATARAGLVTTQELLDESAPRARVLRLVDRQDVQAQLMAYGVAPEEAKARLASLSDAELAQLVGNLESDPAGQNAVGIIVGAAVFVFLVLLITDLLGLTDVFPFVNKSR